MLNNNVSANNMAVIVGELPVIRHCFLYIKSFNFHSSLMGMAVTSGVEVNFNNLFLGEGGKPLFEHCVLMV